MALWVLLVPKLGTLLGTGGAQLVSHDRAGILLVPNGAQQVGTRSGMGAPGVPPFRVVPGHTPRPRDEDRDQKKIDLHGEKNRDWHNAEHMSTTHDAVTRPAHYAHGTIEPLDFIEAQSLGYHEGNVIKYVARARHKGNELQDLKKAAEYLRRRIAQLEAARQDAHVVQVDQAVQELRRLGLP